MQNYIYKDIQDERSDEDKSKSELIDELNEARNKISRLKEKVDKSEETRSIKSDFLWHILHHASIAYQALDAKGKLIEVNDTWLTILGYTRNEVIGKSFKDFFSDECKEHLFDESHTCLNFYKLNDIEIDLIDKAGYPINFIINSHINHDENGYVYSFHSILLNISNQKNIINELKESNQKYKLMLDNVHDLVWAHDMQGNYTFVTPSVVNLFGYTQDEALQRNFTDHMPEEDLEVVRNYLSEIDLEDTNKNQDSQVYRLELRQIRKDGSMFLAEVITSPLRDETGEVIGFQGVTRDITERKEMEQSLRRKERFLNAVLESVQDGINIIDPDFNICRANNIMRRWAGCEGRVEGKKCYEAYYNASEPCSPCSALNCLYSGKSQYIDSPGPVHSQVQWAEVSSHPMRDPDSGHVEYVVEFVRDVTQRKKAEEALRESERQFRQLFEQATIGIFQSDAYHNIIRANQMSCNLLDYSEDELLQMNAEHIIHPEDLRKTSLQDSLNRLQSGETLEIERIFRKKDGTYIYVLVNLGMLGLQDNLISHIVMFQDITDRKQMEVKLQQMSFHDSLTGLYNRNFFEEEMERLRASRYNHIGIIICDLDGLKLVNDTLGHQAGDQMLIQVANLLRQSVRASDILSRIGGDEFAILLKEVDKESLEQILYRLRQAVHDYNNSESEIPLSISLGYALGEGEHIDMHAIFREADNRMYKEKIQHEENARSAILQALSKSMQARYFDIYGL